MGTSVWSRLSRVEALMQIFSAKLRVDGRWDFTVTSGPRCRPIGYCAGPRKPLSVEAWEHDGHGEKYHTDGHASPEDAASCWRQYRLDKARLACALPEWARCTVPGCEVETRVGARIDGFIGVVPLCKEHKNREGLERIL